MDSIPAIESLMQFSAEWTINDTVQWAELVLAEAGVEETRLNAGLLLAHVLQIDRSRMFVDRDRLLDVQVLRKFQSLIERRAANPGASSGKQNSWGSPFCRSGCSFQGQKPRCS
jgi:methylase of polypeptide subunit release factors